MAEFFPHRVDNNVRKGENAHNKNVLLSHNILYPSKNDFQFRGKIEVLSANASNVS